MAQELKPLQLDISPSKPTVTVLPAEAPGRSQLIDAGNDIEAVRQWLSEFRTRPHTYPAYRKEAERLLLWLREQAGKSLGQMSREDWQDYESFLRNPPPEWCGPPHRRGHPKWRPFRGALSESSVRYAISVLKDMVRYLCVAGYLKVNPLLLERTPRQSRINKVERFLPPGSYRAIMAALDEMPRDTTRAQRRYERALFVFVWTEATGARTSELIDTRMAHIHGDFRSEKTRWWWRVIGKGGKESDVPLNSVAVEALKRYRRHLGLYRALPDPATESEYALI